MKLGFDNASGFTSRQITHTLSHEPIEKIFNE